MNALPFALSLSSSVTEIGAIAAFAALLGIAVLSLLVFSQAREIKRLREWAGRAPERAGELEQRVSADAAARAQRTGAPPAPGSSPSPVRVVPRKTPLVSAPVSTAVNATVAAAIPAMGATPVPETTVPSASSAPVASVSTAEATPQAEEVTPGAAAAPPGQGERDSVPGESGAAAIADGGSAAGEGTPSVKESIRHEAKLENSAEDTPAPATAAARAGGVSARSPLPPSPSAPAPPGGSAAPAIAADSIAAASPGSPSRPPGPPVPAARRSVPSRAVAATGVGTSDRPQSRGRSVGAATDAGARASSARAAGQPDSSGPKYFKPERSNGRTMVLIAGGVIVVVLLLVFAVSALKGGGSKAAPTATQSASSGEAQTSTSSSHTTTQVAASNPAEIAVVVLNGTSTVGLAHHLAADLQQSGYTHAESLAGVPPGTHATTTVEYTHGHRADAQAVAKTLDVRQVQAIEGSTASLAGPATVVVLAGADQASQVGGGGAQSKGEPAATSTGASGEAGASGEGAAGSGN